MKILVTGGSASGKSEFAENIALSLSENRFYVATMIVYDNDARTRVQRHREMRQNKHFKTLEFPRNVAEAPVEKDGVVLLDCVGNLVSNEMFIDESFEYKANTLARLEQSDVATKIASDISKLADKCDNIVLVTNEVGIESLEGYSDETLAYIEQIGKANALLAQLCDIVYEVVCGIPVLLKGEAKRI